MTNLLEKPIRKNPNKNHALIKDIWGKEHDVLAEGIVCIFTESQFKMHKYYSSWEEYVYLFQKYNCEIGYCNEEPDHTPDAVINYQELQTLNEMTEDEILKITAKSRQRIENITSDIGTMLRAFGATKKPIQGTISRITFTLSRVVNGCVQ